MAETYLYNIQTLTPKRGDIVIKNSLTGLPKYISYGTYNATDFATRWSGYEKIGNVIGRIGNEALVAGINNASKAWCKRWQWKLTGYTVGGGTHGGVLTIYYSSSASVDYTISYSGDTKAAIVSSLNNTFVNDTTMPYFQSQHWIAFLDTDDEIKLQHDYTFSKQTSNVGKTNFVLTANQLSDIVANSSMKRKHGGYSSEGAISSLTRAITYYTNDNGTDSYMGFRGTVQSSIKQTYPINLPCWLGTSSYQSGTTEEKQAICAPLRAIYGEGQEGWLNFMKSCLPVYPTDIYTMGRHNGKELTAELVAKEYTYDGTTSKMCEAANYCYAKPSSLNYVADGEFWLPTTEEVARLLDGIPTYASSSVATLDSDTFNKGREALGLSRINNSSVIWSCCRCYASGAWYAYGNFGYFYYVNGMCGSGLCVPVSLYKVAE